MSPQDPGSSQKVTPGLGIPRYRIAHFARLATAATARVLTRRSVICARWLNMAARGAGVRASGGGRAGGGQAWPVAGWCGSAVAGRVLVWVRRHVAQPRPVP